MKRWLALLATSPVMVMVEAAVGCAVGICVGVLSSNQCFLSQPAAKEWVVLLGVNFAAWSVLFVPIIQRFLDVEASAVGHKIELFVTLCVFAFLFIVPLYPWVATWISGLKPAPSDYWVLFIGGLVAGTPMLGIWRINAATRRLQPEGRGGGTPSGSATLYLSLQDDLQDFLWIVGVLISLGTLGLGFAVQALNQQAQAINQGAQACNQYWRSRWRVPDVPSHTVWAYGLYYTALLALSYGPTRIALISLGRSMRDAIVGDAPAEETEVEDWLQRRKELGELLVLSQGPLSEIKAAILVVSPLLTSLLSTAIKAPS